MAKSLRSKRMRRNRALQGKLFQLLSYGLLELRLGQMLEHFLYPNHKSAFSRKESAPCFTENERRYGSWQET